MKPNMVLHKDSLKAFIPKKGVQFVIMGTMVAINARTIDGKKPELPIFYYNNNRNHFWRVLQHLLQPHQEVKKQLSIIEKKQFLEKHGIAIVNLVDQVTVKNSQKEDPSDTVLFEAYKAKRIDYKKVSNRVKKILTTKPIFFTSRSKKGINDLVDGFLEKNKLPEETKKQMWFWPTPTRCNPLARSLMWKKEMKAHLKSLDELQLKN